MRDQEPNWGLTFGSGSFLIVWCIGFANEVPFDLLFARAALSAVLGTLLGVLVGYVLSGLSAMRDELHNKGSRVDFTVGGDEAAAPVRPATERGEDKVQEAVVPQAGEAASEGFKPIDLKSSAKQVQSLAQE